MASNITTEARKLLDEGSYVRQGDTNGRTWVVQFLEKDEKGKERTRRFSSTTVPGVKIRPIVRNTFFVAPFAPPLAWGRWDRIKIEIKGCSNNFLNDVIKKWVSFRRRERQIHKDLGISLVLLHNHNFVPYNEGAHVGVRATYDPNRTNMGGEPFFISVSKCLDMEWIGNPLIGICRPLFKHPSRWA